METLATIREFKTRNFRVIIDAIPEYFPDLSWDETGEVSEKINAGEYWVFCARARVIHNELGEIASDYLGECIYDSPDAFQDHRECAAYTRKLREQGSHAICGSYFADMVRTVCTEARKDINYRNNQYIPIRAV